MVTQIKNELIFVNNYKSIQSFEPVELDNFSIFTGKNGSGKTHLLEAIKSGQTTLNSFQPNEIVYFDFETFKTDNTPLKQPQNRSQILQQMYIESKQRISNISKSYSSTITDNELEKLKKVFEDTRKSLFYLDVKDVSDSDLWEKINQYQIYCKHIFSSGQVTPDDISIIKKSRNFINQISDDEYTNSFLDLHVKDNFIPIQLGMLFYDYQLKLYNETNRVMKQSDEDTTKGDIVNIATAKCNSVFDGMPPWEMINEILSIYSDMDHEVIEPQEFDLSKYNVNQNNFPVVIKDKFSGRDIVFTDLSSGEKILFALTLCIFRERLESSLPKVLLLDEIDATLHPSMIKNLLKVIDKVFVKKGIKVILATHSPSTIALCETDSIFVVNRKEDQLIERTSKKEAMFALTQGYASIEEGFHFFDQISDKDITIITEGKNTKYIQKAIRFFAKENEDRIGLILNAESIANDTKLKTLFDLFTQIPHSKKIIFVWDCDCDKYRNLPDTNNTYPYVFQHNYNNTVASRGIENLFDTECFVNTLSKIPKINGVSIMGEMTKAHKRKLMKHMIADGTLEDFKNFKPLFEHIDVILNTEK